MKKVYLIIAFLSLALMLNGYTSKSKENIDFFKEVLELTNGSVVESGLRTSFTASGQGETECVNILEGLELKNTANLNILKNNTMYCIEFESIDVSGYIESRKNDSQGIITINIVSNNPSVDLKEMKKVIEKATSRQKSDLKYFQYIKAKIENSDITYTKDSIVGLLQSRGATNINCIDLERAKSITARTGLYESVKNGDKWIDFNCAVSSYESGNYVIIGTPVIMSSY